MELVKVKVEKKIKKKLDKSYEIILFNDDVNTFDYVINKLVTICGQTMEQAEQCTYIVHYSGKCSVKTGTFEELKPMCLKLLDSGLTAEIV